MIFNNIQKELESKGFQIDSMDHNRPWGGFYVIEETQAQQFEYTFF
jgi:mannose-6-phosphate isomerase